MSSYCSLSSIAAIEGSKRSALVALPRWSEGSAHRRDALPLLRKAKARGHRLGATPAAVGVDDEGALRSRDLAELAVDDRDRAAREDLAFDRAVAERLLVGVALAVAIEDAAHRRVAPVDDADAGAGVEVLLRPDEHVAATHLLALAARERHHLLEAEVREVRALAVDRADGALAAVGADGAERVHLLEEGGQVLRLGGRGELAELEQARVVRGELLVHRGAGGRRRRRSACRCGVGPERAIDDLQKLELLAHDARALFVALQPGNGDLFGTRFGCL